MAPTHTSLPEVELLTAVVQQAVEDLNSPDETARFEAHEFFLQRKGAWAEMRSFYIEALGIDETALLKALAPRMTDPPEHPVIKKNGWEDVYKKLPETPFTTLLASRICGVSTTTMSSRLQVLEYKGLIKRVGRGLFKRTDSRHPEPKPQKMVPDRILDSLSDKSLTIREIGFAMEDPVGTTTIREHLNRLIEAGLVEREAPINFRRTAPHSQKEDLVHPVVEDAV